MLQKAIDILKARWPEVVLLVVLQAAMVLLSEHILRVSDISEAQNAPLPFWAAFLLGLGFIGCAIVWQMMYLGFLRTAAVANEQPQQPMELLRTGRPFFWRILLFQIIVGFAAMLISNIVAMSIARMMRIEDLPQWLVQVSGLVGTLVLIKPILIVTARIIVYDNTVWQSFSYVAYYPFRQINHLMSYIFSGGFIVLLIMLAGKAVPEQTTGYYLYSGLHNLIFSLFLLVPTLAVVLWLEQQYQAELEQIRKDKQE